MRAGFSLTEVALALLILAVAVTGSMLLFPVGIKTQTLARSQIYAAAKAMEMVEAFATFHTGNPAIDAEAPAPWDVHSAYSSQAHDLERRLASYRYGIFPLPLEIAARLDSDADEIQRILAEGGHLYYAQPTAAANFRDAGLPEAPASAAQKLVFAVTGYAQSNAIGVFPWKAWPYYVPWPSPPAHGNYKRIQDGFSNDATDIRIDVGGNKNKNKTGLLWEHTSDPAIAHVFRCEEDGGTGKLAYGYLPYLDAMADDGTSAEVRKAAAVRYVQATLSYAMAKGFVLADFLVLTDAGFTVAGPGSAPWEGHQRWTEVQAMRFLSHAATCLTRHALKTALDAGIEIPSATVAGQTTPTITVRTADIVRWHDRAMRLGMLFAASYPYDWAVPRPLNRSIMMDFPLIEFDLFSPTLTGRIFGSNATAEQWRPLPASPIQHLGRSQSFPGVAIGRLDLTASDLKTLLPEDFWGDRRHVTLTAPFAAGERARQIVFWAVDWQSYADAETAPSAPVDASKYLKAAPRKGADIAGLMSGISFMDWHQFGYRNPEKVLAFTAPTIRDQPDGTTLTATGNNKQLGGSDLDGGVKDRGAGNDPKAIFSGLWGADRNFNKRLDKGPIHPSTRLRAVEVARFNYYDPRLPLTIR